MPVFKSGAFIQQCFSVHPLCLSIKKLIFPEQILVSCSSCNMTHRLTVRSCTAMTRATESSEEHRANSVEPLSSCVEAHPMALGVSTMDVLRDAVGLRCRECRRIFELDISLFETHQR